MPSSKPNILFLLSDEHSFRFMGHRARRDGGEPVRTPNFDRLASQSAVFDTAYCPVPLCVPSRISMMTGLEAKDCGAFNNYSILDPDLDTLPKILGREGYETALVGKMHFGGNLQFHGFQHRPYGDLFGTATHQYEGSIWKPEGAAPVISNLDLEPNIGDDLRARTTIAGRTVIPESLICDQVIATETLSFLRNHAASAPDRPWFLCASFSRPHYPLTAPDRFADSYHPSSITPPYAGPSGASYDHPVSERIREGWQVSNIDEEEAMRARAGYFACVSYLDEIIGDLLRQLDASGLLDNTIIVYTSDHGEMAGELGTWWKSAWYEGCSRVPMMISMPEHRSGKLAPSRSDTPVSTLDLVPTLVSLAGGDADADFSGIDLTDTLIAGQALPERPIYCDHINPRWGEGTEFRAVRHGRWKYVGFRGYDDLLFDLQDDPAETRNVIAEAPAEIVSQMRAWAHDTIDYEQVDEQLNVRQTELKRHYPLSKAQAGPNQYLLAQGLVVEADAHLYAPVIATSEPHELFADWPRR